jgi:hypothetical protein
MPGMTSSNRTSFDRAVDHWNTGDLTAYFDLYDDSLRLHGFGPEPIGKEEARGFYTALMEGLGQPKIAVDEVIEQGDALSVRFTVRGTHVGDFNGVPATGRPVEIAGITHLHFEQGRCVERWNVADFLGAMIQIGAVPAPA